MEQAWLFETPKEIALSVCKKEKELRKSKQITQAELSRMTGIPLATIRYFEQKGEVSFASLIKISLALDCVEDIKKLFDDIVYTDINEVIKNARRNR